MLASLVQSLVRLGVSLLWNIKSWNLERQGEIWCGDSSRYHRENYSFLRCFCAVMGVTRGFCPLMMTLTDEETHPVTSATPSAILGFRRPYVMQNLKHVTTLIPNHYSANF